MTSKLIKQVSSNPQRSRIRSGNEVYVVKDRQIYYRSVVLKIEPEIEQCKCFFVDVGDVRWVNQEDIFDCPDGFRNIPPLAMRFSLYGLVEFKDNRKTKEVVANELTNKEVWAKIKINQNNFYKQSGKHNPIPVILYDSLDRHTRINISADIMKKMAATFKPPQLSNNCTNYATITHISKVTGNIYCHLTNSLNDLKYINAMIDSVVIKGVQQSYVNFQSETELHQLLAINANKLYLIYSEHDRAWYRATILQLETDLCRPNEKNICSQCSVYCFLVDYGFTRTVNLTNVYALPGILAQYPHMAVAMALEDVHMTRANIDRLKAVLSPSENVFVDVVDKIDCGDSNRTKTISMVKITKLEQSAVNNETYVCEINRLLRQG